MGAVLQHGKSKWYFPASLTPDQFLCFAWFSHILCVNVCWTGDSRLCLSRSQPHKSSEGEKIMSIMLLLTRPIVLRATLKGGLGWKFLLADLIGHYLPSELMQYLSSGINCRLILSLKTNKSMVIYKCLLSKKKKKWKRYGSERHSVRGLKIVLLFSHG